MNQEKQLQKLFTFIEESPNCFHAVANTEKMLEEAGFSKLEEKNKWDIQKGGKYYVNRNKSSIITLRFRHRAESQKGFHMVAAHSDSPCFKLKEIPEGTLDTAYLKWNVEKYGGMILSTWLDRPLSIAGRVVYKAKDGMESCLVNLEKDTAIIPNVAIHMNLDMNKGVEYNPQIDMQPLVGQADAKDAS